jgi:predicted NodU family carbamoyl transferase
VREGIVENLWVQPAAGDAGGAGGADVWPEHDDAMTAIKISPTALVKRTVR